VSHRKRQVVCDREVIELLHSDPELLAIADAVAAIKTAVAGRQARPRCSRRMRVRRRRC
jgi:hypothetical protein